MDKVRSYIAALASLYCAATTVACAVGAGTGRVTGTIDAPQCTFDPPTGISGKKPFNLEADFFAAVPIDADAILGPAFPANQMIIRVQHSGARMENANALMFWIFDSAKVARCLRGAYPGGVQEWDDSYCDRSDATRPPRLLIGMTREMVSAFFVLNASCPTAFLSANALGACTAADSNCPDVTICPGRGSWITFTGFGDIELDKSKPIDAAFRVNDGERIAARMDATSTEAAFHVELCDVATVNDAINRLVPLTKPRILGTLEGFFDFQLERGQAGQPFP
ncbi:MAG: hypothetical protein ABJA82_04990 [Myxococcales bacterium]